jgi:2-oxoisovalerate dehydrogenase E1 component
MGDILIRLEQTPENLLYLYETMRQIRRFEEVGTRKFQDGEIPGFMHTCQGEEAVAVGTCFALKPGDMVTSTHRGHGHALARGIDAKEAMAELYGKSGGCNGGRGGSMHMYKKEAGFLGTNGMVGGGIGLVNGIGFFMKYNGLPNIGLTFFGDGASNMGIFYEALNLASSMTLPVVFVCENNLYATCTPLRKIAANQEIATRAAAFNMPGKSVDGSDVVAVHEAVAEARERAVAGEGPTLLEMKTYRFAGHTIGDPIFGIYRSKEEVETYRTTKDPVKNFRAALISVYGISDEQVEELEAKIEREIEDAVLYAQQSPEPDAATVCKHIFMEVE